MIDERLERQLRIADWDQTALEKRIGIVGDNPMFTSIFIVCASALGINNIIALAPALDSDWVSIAHRINPRLQLVHLQGYYSHPILNDIFADCKGIVDLCQFGLANKLLLQKGFQDDLPIVRCSFYEEKSRQGFKIFSYFRGREWREIEEIISPVNLPGRFSIDPVLAIIAAGILLEETKNILMNAPVSDELIRYERTKPDSYPVDLNICIVGAGALGTFVGIALGYCKFRNISFFDPDIVEITNLNRQILFYDAVGSHKAQVLAERIAERFDINTRAVGTSFSKSTDIKPYDVVFDCVDNHETRILISEKCREEAIWLVSGGTGVESGQAVVYDPLRSEETPAELLGLYDIVSRRGAERMEQTKVSCADWADPSVIMTNQIIAGFMVDLFRLLLVGQMPANIFYDSKSVWKI